MPRIFKGIESELRLLLHPCILTGEITDIKVALFTNDPSVAIEFTDRYTIDDNILTLKVPTWAFGTMEDGVINYVIQGMHNDDAFITDRQSNYYLKTPTDYIPEEMPEEVVLGELTTKIVENGVFEYTPSDVDAWNKATIEVNVPDTNGSYDEGYNQGYEDGQNSVECPECPTCNLGEGSIFLTTDNAGFYELYAAEDGYDGWSKFIVELENGGAIKIHKASDLLDIFNNGEQIDFGAYYYVGGKITDITEVSMEWGNATYTLDNGFSVYRGKWFDGNTFSDENQIKVGAYIVVYGIIQEHNGVLGFKVNSQVIAYQECEGGEIVSCNLEDKWVTPSMGERDDNGYIVVEESEGFDGLSRVVLDPTTIYNEGVTAGKAEGGDLIIGTGDIYLTPNERGQRFEILPSEFEYDAFDKFIVEMENFDLGDDANIYLSNEFVTMFWDGKLTIGKTYIVKGQIVDIQRIRPEYGDARYTLDGGFNIYNGRTMGYDLQIFDWVIVIGILSEYDGAPQFSAGSEIKAWWREGGSGNCDDAYNNGYNDGYGNGFNDGQGQVDQYTRPAVIFEGVTEVFVEEPHKLQTDDLVETTAWISTKDTVNKKWCLWTKEGKYEGVSVLNGSAFGGDFFEAKCIRLTGITKLLSSTFFPISAEEIHFGNIEYIETSAIESMNELKKIFYTGDGNVTIDNNAIRGANPNGTLYLKNGVDETPWLERLPEGWVVERLNDDGSVNCGGDIEDYAKNEARVLNITENGTYLSKFSEPIIPTLVTGVYNDGAEFYNYAELNGKVFNTNITPTPITRLELWYKGDNLKAADGWHNIISAEKYHIRYPYTSNSKIQITVGEPSITYDWDENAWHHILIAKETEDASYLSVWVDEVKIGNLSNPSFTSNSTFYINGIEDVLVRNANGSFGMIKIDDTTIIPTEEGFLNVNTGELLEIVQDGDYAYTENLPKYGEGELYKTINVNVAPKINVAKDGIKFGYSTFSEVPEWADFDSVTIFSDMFYSCGSLTSIPQLDTSNATNMNRMFGACNSLTSIPQLNTSNVTDMSFMFSNCYKLQTIPQLNTSNVTNMSNMFFNCGSLITIPEMDTSNVTNMDSMFYSCGNLTTLPQLDASKVTDIRKYFRSGGGGNLTDVGGWKNLKIDWNDNYGLVLCPNLTYQSCINILNGLYDFVGNGESTTKTLKVHQNFLDTVGEEITIGTNKGWTITA